MNKSPIKGRCVDCSHVWVVAYTPMAMERLASVLRKACCPACGAGADRIVLAGDEVQLSDISAT
jgi:Zn finger protein HypA/HybF involved in hydrogenase expression